MKISKKSLQKILKMLSMIVILMMLIQPVSAPLILRAMTTEEPAVEVASPPTVETPKEEPVKNVSAPAEGVVVVEESEKVGDPVVKTETVVETEAPVVETPIVEEAPVVAETEAPVVETPIVEEAPVAAKEVNTTIDEITTPTIEEQALPVVETTSIANTTTSEVVVSEAPKETWAKDGDKAVTNENVELGKTYVAPQNDQVTVTFTKLPENSGKLSIEEITLTSKQVATLGALSNKAYDITSSMENGTFEYNITLPKPKNQEKVEIKFAENIAGLENAETVSTKNVKIKASSVNATLDHFTLFAVTNANLPSPVFTPINSIVANVNTLVTFTASATNPNNGTLTYSLDMFSPVGATINPTSGVVNWTADSLGTTSIGVVVSDGIAPEAYLNVQVTVISPGDFIIYPIDPISVNVNTPITFTAFATNPNNGTLVYSLDGSAPAGATIDPSTGVFNWTPTTQSSDYFNILVSDGVSPAPASTPVSITATFPNIPGPVFSPVGLIVTNLNSPITFTASATNPNNSTLIYSLDMFSPAGATIDPATGVVNWNADSLGTNFINVIVSDGVAPSAYLYVKVLVISPSDFIVYPVDPISVDINTPITFTASATNPNNGTLVYSLDAFAPAGATIDPATGVFNWTPTIEGGYNFNVLVNDGVSATPASTVIDITVLRPNIPGPVFTPVNPITINYGATAAFTVSATNPNAGTLVYSLDAFAPAGASINPTTGEFSWAPTSMGQNVVTIYADDGIAPLASLNVYITMNPPLVVVVSPIAPITSDVNLPISFTVSATNPNNGTLQYSLAGTPPAGATINSTTGQFDWIPTIADIYSITINVNDGVMLNPVAVTVTITVNPTASNPCITLSVPGQTYSLTQDLLSSSIANCISITANNVTLNGNGHILEGNGLSAIGYGVQLKNVTGVTVQNLTVRNWGSASNILIDASSGNTFNNVISTGSKGSGFYLINSNNNNFVATQSSNNGSRGFILSSSNFNTIDGALINANSNTGIFVAFSSDNVIKNSTITNNVADGINFYFLSSNLRNSVYNNYFKNVSNVAQFGLSVTTKLNTTLIAGTNIIGGANIGGNYWTNLVGTGFSETCIDANLDDICDSVYTLGSATDNYPISSTIYGDTTPPVITLTGVSPIDVAYGAPYVEQGAIWTDNVDGTGSAIVGGATVNTSLVGTYLVTYNYTDLAGNPATTVTRTVNVLPSICQTTADIDGNGSISNLEILSYINSWKIGTVSNLQILQGVQFWKTGTGC